MAEIEQGGSYFEDAKADQLTAAAAARVAAAKRISAAYFEAFNSPAGKIVLGDLMAKFGPERARYPLGQLGHHPHVQAAVRDGESNVMIEIKAAMERGGKPE